MGRAQGITQSFDKAMHQCRVTRSGLDRSATPDTIKQVKALLAIVELGDLAPAFTALQCVPVDSIQQFPLLVQLRAGLIQGMIQEAYLSDEARQNICLERGYNISLPDVGSGDKGYDFQQFQITKELHRQLKENDFDQGRLVLRARTLHIGVLIDDLASDALQNPAKAIPGILGNQNAAIIISSLADAPYEPLDDINNQDIQNQLCEWAGFLLTKADWGSLFDDLIYSQPGKQTCKETLTETLKEASQEKAKQMFQDKQDNKT